MPLQRYVDSQHGKKDQELCAGMLQRAETLKADVARMKPKMGQYKKETLERLKKQYVKDKDAFETTSSRARVDFYYKWVADMDAVIAEHKKEIMKEVEAKLAAMKKQYDALNQEHEKLEKENKVATTAWRLVSPAYKSMVLMIDDELFKIGGERSANPARTI